MHGRWRLSSRLENIASGRAKIKSSHFSQSIKALKVFKLIDKIKLQIHVSKGHGVSEAISRDPYGFFGKTRYFS